jgi:subfamily B ATP-binding cassette protein MsbA
MKLIVPRSKSRPIKYSVGKIELKIHSLGKVEKVEKTKSSLFCKMITLIRHEYCILLFALLGMGISTFCALYIPNVLQSIIDQVTLDSNSSSIEVIMTDLYILMSLIAGEVISGYVQSYCFRSVGVRLVKRVRDQAYLSLLKENLSFHNQHTAAELLTKLEKSEDFESLIDGRFEFLGHIIYVIGGIIVIAISYNNWQLTISILIACFIMLLISFPYRKMITDLTNNYIDLSGKLGTTIQESLASYHTLLESKRKSTIFNEKAGALQYNNISQLMYDFMMKKTRITVRFQALILLLTRAGVAFGIYQAGVLVLQGKMNSGNIVSFFIYCDLVYSHMWSTLSWLESYEESNVTLGMLIDMMEPTVP